MATHENTTDGRDGKRTTTDATFVSKRTVGTVTRLLVESEESQYAVLVGPWTEVSGRGWRTGREYRLSGFRRVHPPDALGSVQDTECPECGGALRHEGFVDTLPAAVEEAMESLGETGAVLVATEESEVYSLDSDEVDDWVPRGDTGSHPRAAEWSTGGFVCRDCGSAVDPRETGDDDREGTTGEASQPDGEQERESVQLEVLDALLEEVDR